VTEKARGIARTDLGRFEKGVSGNPVGRPKGSKNKITLLKQSVEVALREQAEPHMAPVLEKCIELALEGDRSMIKLLLEQHMSKGIADDAKGSEKVAIQINAGQAPEIKEIKEPTIDSGDTE
jgi:hypothetical protein